MSLLFYHWTIWKYYVFIDIKRLSLAYVLWHSFVEYYTCQQGLEELSKLQDYLGLEHSHERLQQVLDRCSINKLKKDVHTRAVDTPFVDENGDSVIYRKGEWFVIKNKNNQTVKLLPD